MNRQRSGLLLVLLVSLLLSAIYSPPYNVKTNDKYVYEYAGMSILKGKAPYRDFFDHKPPLIFFWNAAALAMGPRGLWLMDVALVLLATVLFYKLCVKSDLPFPWLLPLLFNLIIRNFLLSRDVGSTREYTALFQLIFFCVLMGSYRYRYLVMGLLSGLVFFMQQEQVLPLAPFLLYTILGKGTVPLLRRITELMLGFLAVLFPILIYFAVHHSLEYFWHDAFLFNLTFYTGDRKSPGEHFRTIKTLLDRANLEIPFLTALVLGVISLFLRHKNKALLITALAALILGMSAELIGGRADGRGGSYEFPGYLLPLSAGVCIVLFLVFSFGEDVIFADMRAQLPYAVLLCTSLSYTSLQHSAHLRKWDEVKATPELAWLRQQKPSDYQLFLFFDNDHIYYYNELNILAPSPWIYQHFWKNYPAWDPDQALLRGIGQDLLSHRTRYIIFDPENAALFSNPRNRDWWMAFLSAHYVQMPVPGNDRSLIWRIRP